MNKYAIAWTEFFENTIEVKIYYATSPLEAMKQCWKELMVSKEDDEQRGAEMARKINSFNTVQSIQKDLWNNCQNVSEPVLV